MTATTRPLPRFVDRDTWTGQVNELRIREKAHTRESDAIAATQRRLPMVEVDGSTPATKTATTTPARRKTSSTPSTSRWCVIAATTAFIRASESVEFDPIANDIGPITTIEITKSRSTARLR